MQVLILVGFMYRLYVYAEILEVDILPYSERGSRNQSSPCDGLRRWHGKPNRTYNSMKHEVLEWLSQESCPCNEIMKSSRIGSTKRQGVSTQGGRIDSSFYSLMPKSEYIIVC
ncbi:hypothetical protein M6B38_144930 [Iris pallida]|uniref:Uncharacterized protein n=1 Tax=Iris pallida TaxID=29817 RepID=A0AAX6FB83_IRIPA|nr:hypothetical protein M6B38_144930 [Iris pallida]